MQGGGGRGGGAFVLAVYETAKSSKKAVVGQSELDFMKRPAGD